MTETVKRAHSRASNTDPKCPKCGGTEIDDQFELIYLGYGEVDCVDWDPICARCGHPLGDDWYDGKEDDFFSIYQSPYKSYSRRICQERLAQGVKKGREVASNATVNQKEGK